MIRLLLRVSIFVFSLNILLISNSFSQNFIDLISTGTNYVPENTYEEYDGSFRMMHNFLKVQYPHVFDNDDILLSKLSLHHYNIYDESNFDLYIAYLQIGFLKHLGEKSSLRMAIYPKIASQLKDVEKNDFLMPAIGMIQFSPTEKLTYGFGLLYSKEIFGHFLNPAIHVKWKVNKSWLFYADFPSYGYLMYHPKKFYNTGIYVSSSTTSFRLSDKYDSAYLQKSYADFSLFLDLCFTENIVMRLKGGYSTMRSLDIYNKDDKVPFTLSVFEFNDERTQLNSDIDDALFFEISINYRYHY